MISINFLKIFFYLSIVLFNSFLPIYLYRKNWKEALWVSGVIVYFFCLNIEFINGNSGAYHDTRNTYEFFLTILKQWTNAGVSVGWNPYMNAGEPLYIYSNYFLWVPWIIFCYFNEVINLNPHTLFNIFLVFLFVNFCTGSLLLFLELYRDFTAALFSFIALLFSAMFITNLGQPTGLTTMYYFPFILFCLVSSYKRKSVYGTGLSFIFIGASLNHYIPLYLILCILVFSIFALVYNFKSYYSLTRYFFNKYYKILLLSLIISFMVGSPALYVYKEISNFVSPSRGGQQGGIISQEETGLQPNVNAPLEGYKVLLEREINYRDNIHHGFYFGIVPLLLIPLALVKQNNKWVWIIFSCVVVYLLLGIGNEFFGFRLLIKYVPGCNMMRHSFGFAHFSCFFLICLSGFGLKKLLCSRIFFDSMYLNISVIVSLSFVSVILISPRFNVFLFGILGTTSLIILGIIRQLPKYNNIFKKLIYMLPIFILIVDLSQFYIYNSRKKLLTQKEIVLSKIVYPFSRDFYPLNSSPIPPDLSPLITKSATLSHVSDNFILLRSNRLNELLDHYNYKNGFGQALGVDSPILFITDKVKISSKNSSKKEIINSIFSDVSELKETQSRSVFLSGEDVNITTASNNLNFDKEVFKYTKLDNPNHLEILVDTPVDGFLVRLENFHPGWSAFIDEKKAPIHTANYAFQAIEITKGMHNIRFQFYSLYPLFYYIHLSTVLVGGVLFYVYLYYLGNCEKRRYVLKKLPGPFK